MSFCKDEAWDFALGLIKVDDLFPFHDFLELVEKEKQGDINTADIKLYLDSKYI